MIWLGDHNMGKNKQNKISVPITRYGKDICRVIFQRNADGKYDIKFEFMGNSYQVNSYRLFSYEPIIWNVENPQNVNMSYHRGSDDRNVIIHLKDESKQGREKYHTLPITRIQPPNTNQLFPIPIFKMEIPKYVADLAGEYRAKSYHHRLEVNDANVIEVFMASDTFDIENYYGNDMGKIMFSQLSLSFEYFSSCSVISDYCKNEYFMYENEPMERFCGLGGIPGMQLFVVKYKVPHFDKVFKQLHITFIENELAEEILLCTKVIYPKVHPLARVYDKIYYGGPTLEQLKPPAGAFTKIPVMCNTTVLSVMGSDEISQEQKDKLEIMAGNARVKLYYEMKNFEEELQKQTDEYKEKALKFLDTIDFTKRQSNLVRKAEKVYIRFAKYCGLEAPYGLYRFTISKGCKKLVHSWLVLDDRLSIDLFPGEIDKLIGMKTQEKVHILRSKMRFKNDELDGVRDKLRKCGYTCSTPHHIVLT